MQSSKGCVRLRDALKCIGMHLGGDHYSHVVSLMFIPPAQRFCFQVSGQLVFRFVAQYRVSSSTVAGSCVIGQVCTGTGCQHMHHMLLAKVLRVPLNGTTQLLILRV